MYKTLFIILILLLISCTSLKETKLKENPQFVNNSAKYLITSPLNHNSDIFNSFIIEDLNQKKTYIIDPDIKDTKVHVEILDSEKDRDTEYSKTKEISSFNYNILNPTDSTEYFISGETTVFRELEENEDESFTISQRSFPIKFSISDNDSTLGNIILKKPAADDTLEYVVINAELFKNKYTVSFQNLFNKKSVTFENDMGLIALFTLEPEGFFASKLKGEAFIKQDVSYNVKSDIISLFVITDTFMSLVL